MTDKDQGPCVIFQGLNDRIYTWHIEVGGRLVQKHEVGRREQKFNQGEATFFTTA